MCRGYYVKRMYGSANVENRYVAPTVLQGKLRPLFSLKNSTLSNSVLLSTKRMQLRNHADAQTVKRSTTLKGLCGRPIYIYNIKFKMLEVHENEIARRNCLAVLRNCAVVHLRGNTGYNLEP